MLLSFMAKKEGGLQQLLASLIIDKDHSYGDLSNLIDAIVIQKFAIDQQYILPPAPTDKSVRMLKSTFAAEATLSAIVGELSGTYIWWDIELKKNIIATHGFMKVFLDKGRGIYIDWCN